MKFPPGLATIWAFLIAENFHTRSQVHKNLYKVAEYPYHMYHQSLANFCGHPVHTTGAIIRYVAQTAKSRTSTKKKSPLEIFATWGMWGHPATKRPLWPTFRS